MALLTCCNINLTKSLNSMAMLVVFERAFEDFVKDFQILLVAISR